ncbi:MAG TPA: glycyl-radical enzyme activating protein [Terriglobales bacterium]|nr:glycyl-radical enzyme activating protein [Terriglobales bacterium]
MTGLIFDIKRYSIHDGPGIRTTVFLKGCPLSCRWCHNPEGIDSGPELMHWPSRCARCYACVAACPRQAIVRGPSGAVVIDKAKCDVCGRCAEACVYDAMQVVGRETTVEELVGEVERDRVFYEQSGGGATFSGGDPLAQPAFLGAALDALRERGIRTALDISGFAPAVVLDALAPKTDLVLYDLKVMDGARHRELTGVPNGPILENLRRLAGTGTEVWARIPLIAGVNDDDANIGATIAFLESLGTVRTIGLLPYHLGGLEKARRLDKEARFRLFEAPPEARLAAIEAAFRGAGFNVQRGG